MVLNKKPLMLIHIDLERLHEIGKTYKPKFDFKGEIEITGVRIKYTNYYEEFGDILGKPKRDSSCSDESLNLTLTGAAMVYSGNDISASNTIICGSCPDF